MIKLAADYLGINNHSKLVDYYNKNCVEFVKPSRRYYMKVSDDWCAMFTSVIAHKRGLKSGQFPFEVSVYEQWKIASEWGTAVNAFANVSEWDLIVYDWLGNGTFDHVGIVEKADNETITAIEGNYGGTVARRTIKRSSKALKGFISLDHTEAIADSKRLEVMAVAVLKGEYGNGQERADLLGADYLPVQRIVNQLLS